jgi:hypothetical protein
VLFLGSHAPWVTHCSCIITCFLLFFSHAVLECINYDVFLFLF